MTKEQFFKHAIGDPLPITLAGGAAGLVNDWNDATVRVQVGGRTAEIPFGQIDLVGDKLTSTYAL